MLDRKKLQANLKRGGQKEIAAQLGVSKQFVCDWFSYRNNNAQIQKVALKVLAKSVKRAKAKDAYEQAQLEAALRGESL